MGIQRPACTFVKYMVWPHYLPEVHVALATLLRMVVSLFKSKAAIRFEQFFGFNLEVSLVQQFSILAISFTHKQCRHKTQCSSEDSTR